MKLVSARAMRSLDRRAVSHYGLKGLVLMENAGSGVARVVERECRLRGGNRVSILTGKGNNGGDGFVAARHLANSGLDVTVFALAPIKDLKGDAALNARIWERMAGNVKSIRTAAGLKKHASFIKHSTVIVDALLGTGLATPVRGAYASAIDFINGLRKCVVAVDTPSGLDATTGRVLGTAVKATITATMALAKTGLYLYPGRDFSGSVEVVDIGMPRELAQETEGRGSQWRLIDEREAHLAAAGLFPRKRNTHKGSYGHVLVVAGSPGKTGAAHMAAMGALRAGAGLVTLAVPAGVLAAVEAKTYEVMTEPLPETPAGVLGEVSYDRVKKLSKGKSAIVIGPGLGRAPDMGAFIERVALGSKVPVVLDADALNALKGRGGLPGRATVLKKGRGGLPVRAECILTPHPGEASRLLGISSKDVQSDRPASASALSRMTGSVVALKGAGTIVSSSGAAPGGRMFINSTGNPGLATAGTGDVLSGIIGGFLAQGLAPMDATVAAVYIHGLAADRVAAERGEAGMVATDLLDKVPAILNSFSSASV